MSHLNPCLCQILWAYNAGYWTAVLLPEAGRGWRDKTAGVLSIYALSPIFTLIVIGGKLVDLYQRWHNRKSPP